MGLLSGSQYQQLTNVLIEAFPSKAKLALMVKFRLNKNLDAIALGDDLKEIVFKLIGTTESEDWTAKLIVAARESNQGNANLLAFAQQFGLSPTNTPSRPELEKIIRDTNSFLDINTWREKLGQIEAKVCRIEISANKGTIYGTGFLISPSLIITNYHVMEAVVLGEQGKTTKKGLQANSEDVVFRFDYKQIGNGKIVNEGKIYHLTQKDWLIAYSSYNTKTIPNIGKLDYALLKLEGEPGVDPVGHNAEPDFSQRGWIEVPKQSYEFLNDAPLIIVQHPEGEPLKLAIDTNAILGLSENGTVVRYKTNTLRGSSGSPCFNINWELVALHHSGDPHWNPGYNAGTPFNLIVKDIEQQGLKELLGEPLL
jgi:V8-like Glu-specific endopeptidase